MTMENESNKRTEPTGMMDSASKNMENSVFGANLSVGGSEEPPSKKIKLEPSEGASCEAKAENRLIMKKSEPLSSQAAETSRNCASFSVSSGEQPVGDPQNIKIKQEPGASCAEKVTIANNSQSNGVLPTIVTPSPAASKDSNESTNSSNTSLNATSAEPGINNRMTALATMQSSSSQVSGSTSEKNNPQEGSRKDLPSNATTMIHLRDKYTSELEYMLREFRKLELQLLGARGTAQLEEPAGSRERREKLHSFILHLEDTVRQIEAGVEVESGGKESSDQADNVQKLEKHIREVLLPVKVKLEKQLANQQGASRNPAGMPAPRRGVSMGTERAQGTFAAAAEQRRKAEAARLDVQQEEGQSVRHVSDPTQFGQPLGGGGSSLTQKLHGTTLGSKQRPRGHGVGRAEQSEDNAVEVTSEKQILYAGMVPGSTQHKSGVMAASGAHEMVIEDENLQESQDENPTDVVSAANVGESATPAPTTTKDKSSTDSGSQIPKEIPLIPKSEQPPACLPDTSTKAVTKSLDDPNLTAEERRKLEKKRRKERRKRKVSRLKKRRDRERQRQAVLHQQTQATQVPSKVTTGKKKSTASKGQGKKKGPRSVEYICALCSEVYKSTCDYNPWWALAQHECPKCRKSQIPRIDITSPANAIEYHPALLAHADENGGGGGGGGNSPPASTIDVEQTAVMPPATFAIKQSSNIPLEPSGLLLDSDSESELSELSDDSLSTCSSDSDGSTADLQSMTAAERAEHESFGYEYKGPVLSDDHAGRLLILMAHASTCPCRHKSSKHRDVCLSTKYMMLHIRDCPGTTLTFDVCPYPWCRKVKHLLYHLVSCICPDQCKICNPSNLSKNLEALKGLNKFRLDKYRERLIAATKAADAGATKGVNISQVSNIAIPHQTKAKIEQNTSTVLDGTNINPPVVAKAHTSIPNGSGKPLIAPAPVSRQPPATTDKMLAKDSVIGSQKETIGSVQANNSKATQLIPSSVVVKQEQHQPIPTTISASDPNTHKVIKSEAESNYTMCSKINATSSHSSSSTRPVSGDGNIMQDSSKERTSVQTIHISNQSAVGAVGRIFAAVASGIRDDQRQETSKTISEPRKLAPLQPKPSVSEPISVTQAYGPGSSEALAVAPMNSSSTVAPEQLVREAQIPTEITEHKFTATNLVEATVQTALVSQTMGAEEPTSTEHQILPVQEQYSNQTPTQHTAESSSEKNETKKSSVASDFVTALDNHSQDPVEMLPGVNGTVGCKGVAKNLHSNPPSIQCASGGGIISSNNAELVNVADQTIASVSNASATNKSEHNGARNQASKENSATDHAPHETLIDTNEKAMEATIRESMDQPKEESTNYATLYSSTSGLHLTECGMDQVLTSSENATTESDACPSSGALKVEDSCQTSETITQTAPSHHPTTDLKTSNDLPVNGVAESPGSHAVATHNGSTAVDGTVSNQTVNNIQGDSTQCLQGSACALEQTVSLGPAQNQQSEARLEMIGARSPPKLKDSQSDAIITANAIAKKISDGPAQEASAAGQETVETIRETSSTPSLLSHSVNLEIAKLQPDVRISELGAEITRNSLGSSGTAMNMDSSGGSSHSHREVEKTAEIVKVGC